LSALLIAAPVFAADKQVQEGPQATQDPAGLSVTAAKLAPLPPYPAEEEHDHGPMGYLPSGRILVPTSQILSPAGIGVTFSGRPVDIALSPDGKTLAALNMSELTLIDVKSATVKQHIPFEFDQADCSTDARQGSYGGLLYGPDGTLYFSTVQGLGILGKKLRTLIPMHIPCGMAFSADHQRLFVAINKDNQLGVVDLKTNALVELMNVGVAPFGVAVAGGKIYVSNWGGQIPQAGAVTGKTSGSRVSVDPKTGVPLAGTVSVIDDGASTIRSIPVGSFPGTMVLSKDAQRLYVANANSDTISVIDTATDKVIQTLTVRLEEKLPFGSTPNGLALSPDGMTLYVANSGNNAVAVIALGSSTLLGSIPTAWYPSALALDAKGETLFVANTKGYGSLDGQAGKRRIPEHLGVASIIPVPDAQGLAQDSAKVAQNNRAVEARLALLEPRPSAPAVPVPERVGEASVFKHVLYIIKENKTYDGVLGDMAEGDGDASLCMYCDVTPNQHKLAREFVLLDHFYCSGALSADGHQWTDEAYASSYIERAFGGFPRSYPSNGEDALVFSPAGFLWSNALQHGLSFRDYGEWVNENPVFTPKSAGYADFYQEYLSGVRKIKIEVHPEVDAMGPYICPGYSGWPMTVPDVYKAQTFIKELKQFEKKGDLPALMVMCLPNDHTEGTNPGSPKPRSLVADNDLALGQIVAAISHGRYWKDTAIFVVEDDPQGMPDHLDGHRTVAQVISAYTRRKFVDKANYNQPGMMKTMELILGLPAMNQFDLSATPMRGCFTAKPDLKPYDFVPSVVPLNEFNAALDQLGPKERAWAEASMRIPMWAPGLKTAADDKTLTQVLWHATRGYDTPYPKSAADLVEDDEDERDRD
jgi:YVTN family beta-propeller protein